MESETAVVISSNACYDTLALMLAVLLSSVVMKGDNYNSIYILLVSNGSIVMGPVRYLKQVPQDQVTDPAKFKEQLVP